MRVFVAGATGAIGRPLVPMLLEAGHDVCGMTRSEQAAERLRAAGAEAIVCDVFDAAAVREAVEAAPPEAIVHQLTAIPDRIRPRHYEEDLGLTNRLRTEGTRNLIDAARAAGASRFLAQSISFAYRPVPGRLMVEEDPLWLDAPAAFTPVVRALDEMEGAVTGTDGLEGTILRYGYFYGAGTSYAADGSIAADVRKRRLPLVGRGTGVFSLIHVEDAAAATVRALESEATGIFNVVDDEPAPMSEWLPAYAGALGAPAPRRVPPLLARMVAGGFVTRMALEQQGASNGKAKRELGFEPRYASWRQGFAETL